jgi:hypothetical protein
VNAPKIQGLTEEERLELAALTAPVLRREDEPALRTKRRRVYVVKRDDPTWTPVREATGADALRGLVAIQDLEHAVVEGVRPAATSCVYCGGPVRAKRTGVPGTLCAACSPRACATCHSPVSGSAARSRFKQGHNPRTVQCRGCANGRPNTSRCLGCATAIAKQAKRCRPCSLAHMTVPRGRCLSCGAELSRASTWQKSKRCQKCCGESHREARRTKAAEGQAGEAQIRNPTATHPRPDKTVPGSTT